MVKLLGLGTGTFSRAFPALALGRSDAESFGREEPVCEWVTVASTLIPIPADVDCAAPALSCLACTQRIDSIQRTPVKPNSTTATAIRSSADEFVPISHAPTRAKSRKAAVQRHTLATWNSEGVMLIAPTPTPISRVMMAPVTVQLNSAAHIAQRLPRQAAPGKWATDGATEAEAVPEQTPAGPVSTGFSRLALAAWFKSEG